MRCADADAVMACYDDPGTEAKKGPERFFNIGLHHWRLWIGYITGLVVLCIDIDSDGLAVVPTYMYVSFSFHLLCSCRRYLVDYY